VITPIFFFFIIWIELPASIVPPAWFALQLFSRVGQLGSDVGCGVAYWAHVGGFAFGALIAWLFNRRRGQIRPTMYGVPPRPDEY
jgi:membrane associated rhomboid family serine protease